VIGEQQPDALVLSQQNLPALFCHGVKRSPCSAEDRDAEMDAKTHTAERSWPVCCGWRSSKSSEPNSRSSGKVNSGVRHGRRVRL